MEIQFMRSALVFALCTPLAAIPAHAQQSADALAKQLANPVAALISVPFQLNYDTGYANNGDKWTLNIQPVIPVDMSPDWNLISRTIVPVIRQSKVVNNGTQTGLGDTVQSIFFSPKAPTATGWIWGAGPVFLIPTATKDQLGTGKWGIGPTAVALKQTEDGWTYGALVNQIWSVAGDSDRADVSTFFAQPFLAKAIGQGRTLTVNSESTYDWERKQWTMPVNFMYSKVTKFGDQLVSLQGGVRVYLDSPQGGPDWGLRFNLTLLYPR